jgi:hypothetical protein
MFMIKQNLRALSLSLGLWGAMSIPSASFAQKAQPAMKLPAAHVRPATAQTAPRAQAADAPTYSYTLVAFPGTLNTLGVGINPRAYDLGFNQSEVALVGAYVFADGSNQTGFRARILQTKPFAETYEELNDPKAPVPQQAYSVNDLGQVVGDYIDASGIFHSYEVNGDEFKEFNVPFKGATGTYSPAINNAGEIVGGWLDSAGNAHSYTLIRGVYTSFDFPGSLQGQLYYAVNSEGDITGSYADASGNIHGFLRRGETYTSIDFPKALYTVSTGINDAGDIVGGYCLTTQCLTTGEGEEGFVLKNGVYTTFAIPGEFAVALASINNQGVLMGNYVDGAGLFYTFLANP